MLLLDEAPEGVLGEFGGSGEFLVTRGAAVQDTAILVDGGVNEGTGRAVILRLNMENVVAHADIGVESRTHSDGAPAGALRRKLSAGRRRPGEGHKTVPLKNNKEFI